MIDANGNRTETDYDLTGNVIKLTDANGHTTPHACAPSVCILIVRWRVNCKMYDALNGDTQYTATPVPASTACQHLHRQCQRHHHRQFQYDDSGHVTQKQDGTSTPIHRDLHAVLIAHVCRYILRCKHSDWFA